MNEGLLEGRLLPSSLVVTRGRRGGASEDTLKLDLADAGTCPTMPTLFIKIDDDSMSVVGGADSTGLRYTEGRLVIEHLRKRCRCDRELVAILHMNRPNSADRPPMRLNRRFHEDIDGGLRIPNDGDGASTLGGTLSRAERIAASHPGHEVVLAVFSDWELTDDLGEIAARLAHFPGNVHAVVLRATAPAELLAHESIHVVEVPVGAQPGLVANALLDAMTVHRVGRRRTP